MLNGLDLFSGIGGNTLTIRQWVRTVAYCENDRHAQTVLLSRMADGSIEPAPIWDDITTLRREHFDVPVDIIVGGFPCQDISVAGKGAGLGGERSGLVFEIFRLAAELSPAFIFLENVPAIRTRGGQRVVQELARLGYDCRWDVLSAFDVGAPHKRDRWFLLAANTGSLKLWDEQGRISRTSGEGAPFSRLDGEAQSLAYAGATQRREIDTKGRNLGGEDDRIHQGGEETSSRLGVRGEGVADLSDAITRWAVEPDVGRVAHGIPFRVDRLKRLGNGVVPAQAREAFRRLMGLSAKSNLR